jgi:quercetin dioxygenase-like cupin family protein
MELELMNEVPTRDQIDRLQAEMATMPQADLQTEHFFSPGMYCRRVFRPAGTLIVGKVHKEPHFFLCAMGEIIAWTETGMRKLQAGDVVECKPGTKRVTLAVTRPTWTKLKQN